jgi:predicted dehydrogenase
VTVEGEFYRPTSFRVQRSDGRVWAFEQPSLRGLQYEAAEVARRVAAGETESPRLTWANTVEVMRTLDEVRAQIGLAYPGE